MCRGTGMIVVLCLFCMGTQGQTIELLLKYERYPDAEAEYRFRPHGFAHLELMTAPPEGDWKLPERIAALPVYASVRIGEQERLLLLDQSSKSAQFYDRVYFDANANRDLTDDPVVDARHVRNQEGRYFGASFPGMDIAALIDGVALPYSFCVEANYWSDEPLSWGGWLKNLFSGKAKPEKPIDIDRLNVYVRPHCMYTAELDLQDAKYRICLGDSNVNGRFDNWGKMREERSEFDSRLWPQGDNFYMVAADASLDYYDGQLLGKYLNLKDALYAVDISITGQRFILTPITEGAARLELSAPVHRINLMNADDCIMAYLPGKTVLGPAGTYRLLNYMIYRDEPEGARWQLVASGTWDSPEVTVAAGAAETYALGEPFRPIVSVPQWARQNMRHGMQEAYLELSIQGAGKEIVSDLACIRDAEKSTVPMERQFKRRPKEATYRVLKPDGEVAAQGTFEYG